MDSCSGGAVSAEDMSTFQAGIVAGLSSMATCSLDSCREEHNAFVPKFMGLIHCADECIPTDTWWNEKKEAPLASVYCILQCFLSF